MLQAVLTNAKGESVSVINYGAIVTRIRTRDRSHDLGDVTLGYRDLSGYLTDSYFLGAVVGRYANRIASGKFELDGQRYELENNQEPNHLHGGSKGFYQALWDLRENAASPGSVVLELVSPDGEGGYPGELRVEVAYTWDDDSRLTVDYSARTTRPTIVNLTQHTYFNLGGTGSILEHELSIAADEFTPTDALAIPTGELEDVTGTPFDFRRPRRIGAGIDEPHPQLEIARGYDHNFVIRGAAGTLRPAATVREARSGRRLQVMTTEPGMQLYTGNFLPRDASMVRSGTRHGYREGFCLETQHFPNSPNVPHFPSTRLAPEAPFRSRTTFEFGID